jgi:hypothetical protein
VAARVGRVLLQKALQNECGKTVLSAKLTGKSTMGADDSSFVDLFGPVSK